MAAGPSGPFRPSKEVVVQTATPAVPAEPANADARRAESAPRLFPPKDADDETRRRWLASSPWPEVVFASL
jgi:hypothetical protein